MRDSLTILAIALIVLLTAALIGPWLIDWSAERGLIEARLTEALGARAKIRGAIDLKLLPSPYFVVDDIEIGDADAPFDLFAKRLRLEMAPAALLRGELDFTEARLDSPRLSLKLSPDGALPLTLPEASVARRFRFEAIAVANGALHLSDPKNNRSFDLTGIDFAAEAQSLIGPFKAKGAAGGADARTRFHFATGPLDKGELSLNLVADAGPSLPGIDLDGRLILRQGDQRFAGAAKFTGADPLWRASGQLTLDAQSAALDQIELRIGDETRGLVAKGDARLDFAGAPRASATLASEAIDLDAWRAAAPDAGAGLAAMLGAALPPWPFTLTYGAKTITFGGAAFTDVSTDLVCGHRRTTVAPSGERDAPSAWLRFSVSGPGRSRLFLDGQARFGPLPGFEGKAQASAEDARWIGNWLRPLAPQWAPQALAFRAIDLSARTTLSPTAFKLRDLVAGIDGADVSGTLDYQLASGTSPARLDADLTTPRLDLGGASGFDPRGLISRIFGGADGALRLEARAVTLVSPGNPLESLGALNIDLARTGEKIELSELTFEGQDGALVTASGLLSKQNAHIDARAVGPRASGLARLLGTFAPGQVSDFIGVHAGLLTPVDLTLNADATEKDSAFAVTALAARGTIGATSIEASVKDDANQAGSVTLSALVQAKDSLPLLRLFGFAGAATAPGAARIEIIAHGPLGGDAQTALKATLGQTSLNFQGAVATNLTQPSAKGAFRFSSADAAPMLRTMGLVFPDFSALLPVTAAGDVLWNKAGVSLANLAADVAGTSLAGALDFGKEAPNRLTGTIAVADLPLAALFGLLLGAPEPAKAGALWSSLAFAPAAFELPNASIALTIKDMALPAPVFPHGAAAKDARFTLLTGPGLMDLRDLNCDAGGGRLASEIKLRRAAGDVSFETHLDFADLGIDSPAVHGRMSGALYLAGAGKSADALAASLAGSGRALLSDLTIPQADPAAVARVFAAFDQDDHKLGAGEVAAALKSELKRADFKVKSAAFDISVAAGTLHLTPAAGAGASGSGLSALFDLRRATLAQRLSLALNPLPKDFSEAAPRITLLFQGPFSSPSVQIDAAALTNAIAARAILRESARIDSYEFDIHERAFFYQRLLSERRREAERLSREKAEAAAQKASNPSN